MKLLGKGLFSKVWDEGKTVLIHSVCPVKECIAMGWGPSSKLFPRIERLDDPNDYDDTRAYRMKKYERITAPKQQLNARSYKLYKILRGLDVNPFNSPIHRRSWDWYEAFNQIPNEFKTQREALKEMIHCLGNYGQDFAFEISPRNIAATGSGNLVLLDCFFSVSKAQEIRTGRR